MITHSAYVHHTFILPASFVALWLDYWSHPYSTVRVFLRQTSEHQHFMYSTIPYYWSEWILIYQSLFPFPMGENAPTPFPWWYETIRYSIFNIRFSCEGRLSWETYLRHVAYLFSLFTKHIIFIFTTWSHNSITQIRSRRRIMIVSNLVIVNHVVRIFNAAFVGNNLEWEVYFTSMKFLNDKSRSFNWLAWHIDQRVPNRVIRSTCIIHYACFSEVWQIQTLIVDLWIHEESNYRNWNDRNDS